MKQKYSSRKKNKPSSILMVVFFLILLGLTGLLLANYSLFKGSSFDSDSRSKAAPVSSCSASFDVTAARCNEVCEIDNDCETGYCMKQPPIVCIKAPCNQPAPVCRSKSNPDSTTCASLTPPTPTNRITPTGTPISTPHPLNNVKWVTPYVTLTADDFYILANGKKYYARVSPIDVHSDPGYPTYTTLEVTWHENDVEMRLYMYIYAQDKAVYGQNAEWWVPEMRTYNGNSYGTWIMYTGGRYFSAKLGQADTRSEIQYGSDSNSPIPGAIYFKNLKLLPTFKSSPNATPIAPSPTPVSTVKGCIRTGCSGQICSDKDVASTCEYRQEYACYKTAVCERQANGACGWTPSAALAACLQSSGTTPPPVIISAMPTKGIFPTPTGMVPPTNRPIPPATPAPQPLPTTPAWIKVLPPGLQNFLEMLFVYRTYYRQDSNLKGMLNQPSQ